MVGNLCAESITPGGATFEPGVEVLAVSASLEQSRVALQFCREALADRAGDYRWLDSGQRLAVTHKASGAKFRILSSSGKRALGLSGFSTIYGDEPGAWEERGGALMWDALRTSLGKRPGQRLILIGTRAPAAAGSWWPEFLDAGSGPGTHVEVLTAPDGEAWDDWQTIRRCNPMIALNPELGRTIKRERDEARRNPSLRPAFEAFRLNRQIEVGRDVLLTVGEWDRVEAREVPPRAGRPIVGLDLGGERSWSAAWALWPNGRSECFATVPGIPSLEDRERQDAMPRGIYQRLADAGVLIVDEGRHMARPLLLIERLIAMGIDPVACHSDRFAVGDLRDAIAGRWPLYERKTRWSEATADIAAFRRIARDGPLAVAEECRLLVGVSLSQSVVRSDEQGGSRVEKHRHGRSRDDVAIAAVIASGAWERAATAGPLHMAIA